MPQLKELYLAENYIAKIEGIANLKNLSCLDLSYNKISKIENIETL